MDVKMMDLTEFRDLGLLQEVNRCFFHPLGLALAVNVSVEDGAYVVDSIAGIFDNRDDPEGYIYHPEDLNPIAVINVNSIAEAHAKARYKLFHPDARFLDYYINTTSPFVIQEVPERSN
jgi:hypothetical protein